jgi:hypothetical protein
MSGLARLASFAAALVVVFGGATFAGATLGPDRTGERAARSAGGHGMDGGAMAPASVRGLAVSEDGLTLRLARRTAPRGKPFELALRIADRRGATVRRFDVEHTRRLHLIAVRRDLTGYQHVHPVQAADGSWAVPLRFAQAGVYRVYADFKAHGAGKTTLATDVFVPGDFRPRAIPAAASRVSVDGYDVALKGAPKAGAEGDLDFTVSRGGRPVAVQPYLGADGHLVALREGDLAYLHVHPQETAGSGGPIRFMTEYPSAGRYRLFLQFRHGGTVHTAAFTQDVS